MEIAIIADTHMPRGPRRLPVACVERLRSAELIIHAGDLMALSVLEELESYGPVVAVHGNVDEPEVRGRLPSLAVVPVADRRIYVIHDAGPSPRRLARLRSRFPEADAVVFGHSHLPLHERDADGFQIFNPGSPTERRRSPHHTMGIVRLGEAGLEFELIDLG
jgi:putative phosphoesterase